MGGVSGLLVPVVAALLTNACRSPNADYHPAPAADGPVVDVTAADQAPVPALDAAAASDGATAAGIPLIMDPGFEAGTSGFFAPNSAGDLVAWTRTNAISGGGSLQVRLGAYGSGWWILQYVKGQPYERGKALTFSATVRRESASTGLLRLCAVVYTVALAYLQACADASAPVGEAQVVSITLTFTVPPGGTADLDSIRARLMPADLKDVVYTVDDASLVLAQ